MGDTLKAGSSLGTGDSLTSANGAYTVTLQDDGNLVLSEGGNAVWATGTNGSGATSAKVQEDGNFVLYAGDDKPVWASDTAGKSGVSLVLQDDRNLVLYEEGGQGVWSSRTVTDTPPAAAPEAEPEPAQTITETQAPPPPPPPPPAPRTYTVVSGDTLWAISERFYGDGNRYREIASANGIANPDLINVGQVLTIP